MTLTATTDARTWNEKFNKIKSYLYEESSAAIASTIAPSTPFRIIGVRVNSDGSVTTSENLTLTIDANAGAGFDAVMYTKDLSTVTFPYEYWFDPNRHYNSGDEIDIAFTNTEGNQINIEVLVREPYSA